MDKDAIGAIVDDFADVSNDAGGNAGGDTGGDTGGTNDGRINGYDSVDPITAGGTRSSGTGRKRGRPAGSKNGERKTQTPTKNNLTALENILLSVHFGVSALLSTPELDINEDEAKKFAGSLARISNLYDDRINPKAVAWVDLIAVLGAIYGPRMIAIHARMKAEKAPTPARATVINMPRAKTTPTETAARSPMDLFGDMNYGAGIPEAR